MNPKKSETTGEASWLDGLESTVRRAGETVAALRGEKAELEKKVRKLETRIAQLEGSGDAGGAQGSAAADAWREEREEIRDRVQGLTERLEALLDE